MFEVRSAIDAVARGQTVADTVLLNDRGPGRPWRIEGLPSQAVIAGSSCSSLSS
jgi:hypothetical protein